ncbi:MAG: hypothetical protein DRJ61_05755 [Acidobacteria bacterium]|nr:MAG: hypothetical protein DRJ61_05755 [Acidobacteriota bacterium]
MPLRDTSESRGRARARRKKRTVPFCSGSHLPSGIFGVARTETGVLVNTVIQQPLPDIQGSHADLLSQFAKTDITTSIGFDLLTILPGV